MPTYRKFTFQCTNGSGFHGAPGNTIFVQDSGAAYTWDGGGNFLDATSGTVGFSPDRLILERPGGGVVAEIILRKTGDDFSTIPVTAYISGVKVYAPKKGVNPAGWRWRLFSRI
jgi:hypothetical protein